MITRDGTGIRNLGKVTKDCQGIVKSTALELCYHFLLSPFHSSFFVTNYQLENILLVTLHFDYERGAVRSPCQGKPEGASFKK
jgi:hypothetical protein